jgi:uncharacterized protein (TIGR02246 family)
MTDVERLLAIEAIKQLKARYFRTMDTKDWDGFADVFARDALMEVPEAEARVTGRAEIAAFVSGSLVGATTTHHGHMPEIELVDDTHARGLWAMFDYVEWPKHDDGTRIGLQGYGHYHEEYVYEDGEWRIAHTRLVRLRVDWLGAALG